MSIIRKVIQEYLKNAYNKTITSEFISWINRKDHTDEKDKALFEFWNELNTKANESTIRSFNTFKTNNLIANNLSTNAKRKQFIIRFSRIAIILLLPVISVLITLFIVNESDKLKVDDIKFVECIVPNGETRTIILPDSSVAKLNSGTIIIYPEQFKHQNRDIYLNGEAFFTVKHDSEKPFLVRSTDIDIEVLGTVFNVSSYTSDQISSTTLESGKIKIYLKNKGESLILNPDEQITYNRQTHVAEVKKINAIDATSWTTGNFYIESSSIERLAKAIERKYGVDVYLSSSKFKDEKITMRFMNNENLNECMDILQQIVPGLKYEIDANKVFIY